MLVRLGGLAGYCDTMTLSLVCYRVRNGSERQKSDLAWCAVGRVRLWLHRWGLCGYLDQAIDTALQQALD